MKIANLSIIVKNRWWSLLMCMILWPKLLYCPEAEEFWKCLQFQISSYFFFFTSLKIAFRITGNYASVVLVVGVTLAIADFISGFNISFDMTWNSQYQNVCGIPVEDIQPILQNIGQKYGWNEMRMNEIFRQLFDFYDDYHFGSDLRVFNGESWWIVCSISMILINFWKG